jgi:uncharacterized protein YkwD
MPMHYDALYGNERSVNMRKQISQWRRVIFSVAFLISLVISGCSNGGSHSNATIRTDLESPVHDKVNNYRASQGKSALGYDDRIAAIARTHSLDMANKDEINHDGFDGRVSQLKAVLGTANIAVGENVAYNCGYSDPVQVAVDGWINSEGHRKNMIGDYNWTGIGVAVNGEKYYFTQIFVKK